MQVIHLINSDAYRGGEVFAVRLAAEQACAGEPVRVMALALEPTDLGAAHQLSITALSAARGRAAKLAGALAGLLNTLAASREPVTLQANVGDTLWVGAACRALRPSRVRLVYRHASMTSFWLRKRRLARWVYGRLLARCDAIASISADTAHDLVSLFPTLAGRVTVIPNGIPMMGGQARAGEGGAVLRLLHVGAFTAEKNQAGLLGIVQRLVQAGVALHLTMLGDGPLHRGIAAQVQALGLGQYVTLAGAVTNVRERMRMHDVLLLPSLVEGQPGVILEAFAEHLPVLAYEVGGVGELLAAGRGISVPLGDEAAFAAVLAAWGEQSDLAGITGRAHAYAVEHFDIVSIAARFSALYRNVWNP